MEKISDHPCLSLTGLWIQPYVCMNLGSGSSDISICYFSKQLPYVFASFVCTVVCPPKKEKKIIQAAFAFFWESF